MALKCIVLVLGKASPPVLHQTTSKLDLSLFGHSKLNSPIFVFAAQLTLFYHNEDNPLQSANAQNYGTPAHKQYQCPVSSKCGTYKTVKVRLWPYFRKKSSKRSFRLEADKPGREATFENKNLSVVLFIEGLSFVLVF